MFRFPFGTTQELNLDWFLEQWEIFKQEAQTAFDGIDHALDAEIERVEAAMTDLYAARDAAIAARNDSLSYAQSANSSALGASQSAQNSAASAVTSAQQAQSAAQSAQSASEDAADALSHKNAASASATAAQNSANNAGTSAGNALSSAQAAEAWATGEIGGVPVPPTADQYENNAKYYAESIVGDASAAAASAAAASTSETNAAQSAQDAADYAQTAANQITFLTPSMYATKNAYLQNVPLTEPFYTRRLEIVNGVIHFTGGTGVTSYRGFFITNTATQQGGTTGSVIPPVTTLESVEKLHSANSIKTLSTGAKDKTFYIVFFWCITDGTDVEVIDRTSLLQDGTLQTFPLTIPEDATHYAIEIYNSNGQAIAGSDIFTTMELQKI